MKNPLLKFVRQMLLSIGIEPHKLRRFYRFDLLFDESGLISDYFLRSAGKRDGTFVDVGAAWGAATRELLLAGWTGHAFEPDTDERKIEALTQLAGRGDLTIDRRAVSDESGKELSFYRSDDSEGISSLHQFSNHYPANTVTTVTLEDYLAETGIAQVDLLKCDAEGHDIMVLRGFPFESRQPDICLVEFDQGKAATLGFGGIDESVAKLESHGYQVLVSEWFPIKRYGAMHRFKSLGWYQRGTYGDAAWGNLIAVRSEIADSFVSHAGARIPSRFLGV